MSCSACAANTLQRFIGGFAGFTASTSNLYQARILSTLQATHEFSTNYTQQIRNPRGSDAVTPFNLSTSGAFNEALAPITSSEPRAQQYHGPQRDLSREVLRSDNLQGTEIEEGVKRMRIQPDHASGILRLRQKYPAPRASSNLNPSQATQRRGDRLNRLGSKSLLGGRTPRNTTDRTSTSRIKTTPLDRAGSEASRENAREHGTRTGQYSFSVKNDGRTKSWSALGRHTKGSNTSGDRSQPCARESWQIQKSALSGKFGQTGWAPRKRLSPDTMEGIRGLHAQYPEKYTTPVLADQFKVSPEAIRRILKSRWKPTDEEDAERRERWNKRGESIWIQMANMGVKPPKKWRRKGIGRLGELIARGQYPAPQKWRPRLGLDAERRITGTPSTPTPVLESRRYQIPLADRII